jgi:hypothetical protein
LPLKTARIRGNLWPVACICGGVLKARRQLCALLCASILIGGFILIGGNALFASSVTSSTPLPANTLANAVQVDAAGNLYLAGFFIADSQNPNAPAHAFVAKLTPDASQTIWWTVLAGSNDDRAQALALGSGNSVYVTGKTQSTDFPTTPGSMQPGSMQPRSTQSADGPGNTFAAELNASGAVVYSTYIPATSGQAIAVDAAGQAFITGMLAAGGTFQATPGAVSGAANTSQLEAAPSWPLSASAGTRSRSTRKGTFTPRAHSTVQWRQPLPEPFSRPPLQTIASRALPLHRHAPFSTSRRSIPRARN